MTDGMILSRNYEINRNQTISERESWIFVQSIVISMFYISKLDIFRRCLVCIWTNQKDKQSQIWFLIGPETNFQQFNGCQHNVNYINMLVFAIQTVNRYV